ncbi:hypothetical protein J6590_081186 [Homalodisca vitripennis]|nr:hypothetical protein J6590_081186 [Homalodisca vitripennis]
MGGVWALGGIQGIIFEGGQEVLLTDSHWKISLRYNLTELQVQGQNLSGLVIEVKEYLDQFYNQLLRDNVSMHSPLPQLEAGFRYEFTGIQQNIKEYLREVMDAGGHVLRYLFGTLGSSDLEEINSDVKHLYAASDSIIHNSQEQITILSNVQSELVSHSKTINSILSTVKAYHAEGRKLSSDLLSPLEFLKILQEVEKSSKLHLPVKLENMHEYYSVVIVRSYVIEQTLRVVLQLPLKMGYEKTKFFVSKDRLQYTLYDETKFSQECLNGRLIVCPLEHVLSVAKRPSCVSELFIRKMSSCYERKLITGLRSPVLLKTPNQWVYSTSEPHRVTLNCYESNGKINVTSLLMSGVGITESYKCDVITDEFKVPARMYGSSTHVRQLGKMVIPDLRSMFSDDKTNFITVDVNATLEVLDDELGSVVVREYPLEWALFSFAGTENVSSSSDRNLYCFEPDPAVAPDSVYESGKQRLLTSVLAMSEAAMPDVEMGGGAQTTDELGTAARKFGYQERREWTNLTRDREMSGGGRPAYVIEMTRFSQELENCEV